MGPQLSTALRAEQARELPLDGQRLGDQRITDHCGHVVSPCLHDGVPSLARGRCLAAIGLDHARIGIFNRELDDLAALEREDCYGSTLLHR